ncbi:MAG: phosphopyruvate hydratase [Candidatus Bathyarchaeota archaeon]|nr:MAG: phosphopyruvate hydratase [Candidatus Bathyarchaeota archaeon]
METEIKSIAAVETFSRRGYVTLQVTVITEDGTSGTHTPTSGISIGAYEAAFLLDGGERWFGRGALKAVRNVNTIIGPRLKGMDVMEQRRIDKAMIELDGTPDKSRLGANAIIGVSLAVLKAAAKSRNLPLYRHIGGVDAVTLPCPIIGLGTAGTYRDPGKTRLYKPSFEYTAYGAESFSDAVYITRIVQNRLEEIIRGRYGFYRGTNILSKVQDDREALEAMTEAIDETGHKGKVGIFVDCAAGCYYEHEKDRYVGLFYKGEKTREDMIELYKDFVSSYPFVVLEDPLHEDDFEGHAILRKELGIEIVGDDLFTTNPDRLKKGIEMKAANAMVLKIPQIGTYSEAMDAVGLAQRNGYGVGPCGSRGDPSADLAVGLNTGQVRGDLNRILEIERELGSSARFLGRRSFKTK